MPTIAAMQTSAPFARASAFGAAARHRRQVYAVCALICLRGALAFRRSAAALARANASAVGSAPVPAFPETRSNKRYPFRSVSSSTELLGDRSSCRSSGGPEPPGSGWQICCLLLFQLHNLPVCRVCVAVGIGVLRPRWISARTALCERIRCNIFPLTTIH